MLQDIKTLVYPQYLHINFLSTSAVGKNYVIGYEQISYPLLKFVKEVQHSQTKLRESLSVTRSQKKVSMVALISGHRDVALGGVFALVDIIRRNGVSPGGVHDVGK